MEREFIETREFQKRWRDLGLSQEDLRIFQQFLLSHPDTGGVIQGTGGVRKVRWARNSGKSGGVRILYIDFIVEKHIYFLTLFAKNEKDNLSNAEKAAIKTFIKSLKKEY